ncbi:MAG: hypothetical protein N3E47_03125 [Candidatus Bathyarchaeota archaeon]|nr:hypothetical protein [Candidatus Bathyarchaeota archaeon]
MQSQRKHPLRKKVEEEFVEEGVGASKLIEMLVKSFLRAGSDYGAITDIKTDVDNIYMLVKSYISEKRLDIYVLKIGDRILMSKTNENFDRIYEVIKERSSLEIKRGIIEIWDDSENGLLHFLIIPLRKHFPIEYATDSDKEKTIKALLDKYSDLCL